MEAETIPVSVPVPTPAATETQIGSEDEKPEPRWSPFEVKPIRQKI